MIPATLPPMLPETGIAPPSPVATFTGLLAKLLPAVAATTGEAVQAPAEDPAVAVVPADAVVPVEAAAVGDAPATTLDPAIVALLAMIGVPVTANVVAIPKVAGRGDKAAENMTARTATVVIAAPRDGAPPAAPAHDTAVQAAIRDLTKMTPGEPAATGLHLPDAPPAHSGKRPGAVETPSRSAAPILRDAVSTGPATSHDERGKKIGVAASVVAMTADADDRDPSDRPADPDSPATIAVTPPAAAASAGFALPDAAVATALPDPTAHHLDAARHGAWLDGLARDIAGAAAPDGRAQFAVSPEHLGEVKIEVQRGDDGATVRLTTADERARAILADARPQLAAEARASGLRIAEASIDLSGRSSGGGTRQPPPAPIIRTAAIPVTTPSAPIVRAAAQERYA